MKRTIVFAACLAVAFLAGLGVGLYMKRGTPMAEKNVSNHQASDKSRGSDAPWVFDLPMQIAYFGNDEFSPCYFDLDNKVLYRWNGLVLRKEQLPEAYTGSFSRIRMLNAKDFSQIVSVEAPVNYREVDGKYRVGSYFRPCQTFFEWKGVVLNREKVIPRNNSANSVLALDVVSQVIEIDIPPRMKEFPQLWRRP